MLIWMAEKMNTAAANKLLKLIEEPPEKTVLLLIAEEEEQIISTILSRCQILHFPPLAESVISKALEKSGLTVSEASSIAQEANGNYNKALDLVKNDSEDLVFEQWFVQWVRSAFKAKGNRSAVHDLVLWSDVLSKTGREVQKQFLNYCITVMRQALFLNYNASSLVYLKMHKVNFDLKKFAPFVLSLIHI